MVLCDYWGVTNWFDPYINVTSYLENKYDGLTPKELNRKDLIIGTKMYSKQQILDMFYNDDLHFKFVHYYSKTMYHSILDLINRNKLKTLALP